MRVGVLTASVSRQAGGLFWSVRSLALETKRSGSHVEVFSVGDQFAGADAPQWGDIGLNVHSRRGPRAFGYAPGLGEKLEAAALDVVHTHGLWMYPSVVASRWAARDGRPLVVSPRGMLDPWAVKNAAWKKRMAGWLFENRHLRQAACLHALNEAEYQAIRSYGLTNPVAVIPNGVDLPSAGDEPVEPVWASGLEARQILLFLGRLHPKKGLANLLQAWARVGRQAPAGIGAWHLAVAGWDQGGHETALRTKAETLGIGETVSFIGPQFGAEKTASLARADAFILPSFSEGLPIAVLEAWAHRLPVLMTPQCNLPEGFDAGAAMEIATDADSIAEGLAEFFGMTTEERLAMGDRGRRLVAERFDWSSAASRMSDVYAWILGRGERPACVRID